MGVQKGDGQQGMIYTWIDVEELRRIPCFNPSYLHVPKFRAFAIAGFAKLIRMEKNLANSLSE